MRSTKVGRGPRAAWGRPGPRAPRPRRAPRQRMGVGRLLLALAALAAGASSAAAWELRVCADPDAAPYSLADGSGFDNRIAAVLADRLGAQLTTVPLPDHRSRTLKRFLHAGACDVALGVLDGQSGFLTSHAYYRTGYTFVWPAASNLSVASLDDPALKDLTIGLPGGARKPTPPAMALARRGLLSNLRHFTGRAAGEEVRGAIHGGLKDGSLDMAILWGPDAGMLARADPSLTLAPVTPQIDIPFLPMIGAFTVGVRPHDEALRDAIDIALAEGWDDVQAILEEAGVPVLDLPRPVGHAAAPGEAATR